MDAAIITLQDGTPCIVHSDPLPHPIRHIEFSRADYQLTLVYHLPAGQEAPAGKTFAYPLDHPFVRLLEQRQNCAVARLREQDLFEIQIYPVIFRDNAPSAF